MDLHLGDKIVEEPTTIVEKIKETIYENNA